MFEQAVNYKNGLYEELSKIGKAKQWSTIRNSWSFNSKHPNQLKLLPTGSE